VTAGATPVPSVEEALGEHAFFRGLPRGLLHAAATTAEARSFRAGEYLLQEGKAAGEMFAVLDGKVALEVYAAGRRRLTVQTVGRGEIVGWSWLTPPHRWTLDAIAVKPTRAIVVEAAALWARFAEVPEDGYVFLRRLVPVLAGRIQAMEQQLVEADVL
jgi:CRP/FNR family transcriptional regulator, cyclic AMP receptor protein